MTRSQQVDAGEMGKRRQKALFGLKMTVADVADGVATIQASFDRVAMELSGAMESEYDSQKDPRPAEGDDLAQALAAMVGRSFRMKLRDTGEIAEVTGFSDLMAAVLKDTGGAAGMLSHLEAPITDGQAKAALELAFPRLPKEAVAEGGAWKDESALSIHMLGEVPARSRSKLTGIRGRAADFETTTRLELEGGEGGGMPGRVEIWSAAAGAKGTWDTGHGRLARYERETRITAEAHGQEVEIVLTSETRWAPTAGK